MVNCSKPFYRNKLKENKILLSVQCRYTYHCMTKYLLGKRGCKTLAKQKP